MKILLVKMSSMGDVFHTLPALSDALQNYPNLKVDWIVESDFSIIPTWHNSVNKVYPIKLRKWRKSFWKYRKEIKSFFATINQENYDFVIDAQGLLKSAWVIKKITAKKIGMDWSTVREPLASLFYDVKYNIPKNMHAIDRLRLLFSKALNFSLDLKSPIKYHLSLTDTTAWDNIKKKSHQKNILLVENNYVVGLHSTTWDTKLWPENNWIEFAQYILNNVENLILPWGTDIEFKRAKLIYNALNTKDKKKVWIPETRLSLNEMVFLLKKSKGVLSVDTGFSHVASALEVPTLVLYRVTDPAKVGAKGMKVKHLISPLATKYLKKFTDINQEQASLQGIGISNVKNVFDEGW